jgi:transposase
MLQPLVRRTWAPRGETPVHRSWDRHDRLSVITALTVSPMRRDVRLFFSIKRDNIRTPDALEFVRALRRQMGSKLLLVWDRLNVHRAAAKELIRCGDMAIEWLPPYAPDLNPVEQVWNNSKYSQLANYLPVDIDDLHDAIAVSLTLQAGEHSLLRNYFQHAGLSL